MTDQTLIPTLRLWNGVEIPRLGLGTSPMGDDEAETMVAEAIKAGYRLIDTAENYRNEGGVGRAIRSSGVDRSELFVTTKFNKNWHGYKEVEGAFNRSAGRLGLDYIDLLLIHWPVPAQDRYVDAWRGMIRLLEEGKVRAIGVSNFKPAHIDRLLEATGVAPHLNQVQLNPYIGREAERTYHAAHAIATESWSPIGKGRELLGDPLIVHLARRHSRTPAQIVLRWHVGQGLIPIPRTSRVERLAENADVFNFDLTADEMAGISALDRGGEGAADSDRMGH
jgi:2,5-diketo-D-gluconate reductase A